ncbi:hypothetical protein GUITHDRAFT_148698 [Guillardia theta CCMP2712]|uniref:FAD-binding PCMH-type domain-containing protein n=1 Tax=Guillardia theta (strain CCMP2712) TaxID=905079 RepID=L1I8E2_GUITC|nr:hypothetical protein GUITHDRAFT_148698 [Guillardia theta CCMP2712]EKX32332.1 hypothetical protein GUITHDRAFT_148698 [Guillardia theta CCMP2712]|eukprot:XP_005819312.1 hypothetical protein GUITHDRAFT_148698 [Guillardia theta CCMP2712]
MVNLNTSGVVPVGADHSWSRWAETSFLRVDMKSYNRILGISTLPDGSQAVHVQAGCLLRSLISALSYHDLCIPSVPILLDQTIGGMISTGSHGSSLRYGTTSELVKGLKMILPNGELKTLGCCQPQQQSSSEALRDQEVDDESLFRAARMSLGQLGIITEVVLRVERVYHVEQEVISLSIENFCELACEEGRGLHASYEHVWGHMRLGGGEVTVVGLRRKEGEDASQQVAKEPCQPQPDARGDHPADSQDYPLPDQVLLHRLESDHLPRFWKSDRYHGKNWFPFPPPQKVAGQEQEDDFGSGKHLSLQYNFPLNRLREIVTTLLEASMFRHDMPTRDYLGRIVEIKFIGKEKNPAMLGASEALCCFNIYWKR